MLRTAKPDLIIACYGMNCGIYQPLDDSRFEAYRNGTDKLRAAAKRHGAEVVHVTPPIYDSHGKPGFDYDEVLASYSRWLVEQRMNGWHVADLHSDMRAKVDAEKKRNPAYTVQSDKVHPNRDGHWMMAQNLIRWFGDDESANLESAEQLLEPSRFKAVQERMLLFQKAIHAETKPLRPGVPQGGTMATATEAAAALAESIYGSD